LREGIEQRVHLVAQPVLGSLDDAVALRAWFTPPAIVSFRLVPSTYCG